MSKRTTRTTIAIKAEPAPVAAGEFASWLGLTRHAQRQKTAGSDVPCGECNACCRSSYFIHLTPADTQAVKRIPKALLFPAPGLPKGNVLMGYNDKGQCPMLVENTCSIYAHRPQTCRDYDCRIYAATGIELTDAAQASIAERVANWRFAYPGEVDRKEHAAVLATAAFLRERKAAFPPRSLPGNPAQLAILAIKVHRVFFDLGEQAGAKPADADIAKAVMAALEQFDVSAS
ncbi:MULTISPECIES: YkgJ family cysteine cluster protein [unclassified Janthinobacterium]|uniref:YkgJ family cysteine cluster protein n=1 Tax=unclassified Janthinobacterium TaxID=2610881 RepID=UPI00034B43C5|nr:MULTISPECIES: YkgJ family cysteine cluster protein [unclassified Janthinobacterium]MEC5160461.1 Fe-S-cluster containining protein [Janthinobacterium sp. CG_S6]